MAFKFIYLKYFFKTSKKFESFLQPVWIGHKQSSYYAKFVNNKKSNEKNFYHDIFKYSGLISLCTAISFFWYSRKNNQILTSLFPAVHALAQNDNSLRKRFNFISEVVEKSADAVVFLENTILYRLNGVDVSGVRGGSGFIIRDDGLILTNAHVVADRESNILHVKLKDGRIFDGVIENVDFATDLATVRIKAKNLPVMPLGSSTDLKAGEWVIAMGSPLFLKDSVSVGIISSLRRKGEEIGQNDMEFIQTDAAIAMGNSGGPLVNLDGEAVGVNALGVTSGISFAIPIDYAKEFLKKSEEGMKHGERNIGVKWPNYIGIFMQTITPEILYELRRSLPSAEQIVPEAVLYGVLINSVSPGSPAFKSGLLPGDIIVEVNRERLVGTSSFFKFLESQKFLNLKVFRGHSVITLLLVPEGGG